MHSLFYSSALIHGGFAAFIVLVFTAWLVPSLATATSRTETLYKPHRKHPALFADEFPESWLHPDALEILESAKDESINMTTDVKPLKQEMPEVYSFNCLSTEFLQLFNEEIANFHEASEKYQIPSAGRPNNMNNYGVFVNEIGMRPMITALQQTVLWPLARRLFPVQASEGFDDHRSFTVDYRSDQDMGVDMHTDDSDVTFNVCLGHNFTGASLSFCGTMGAPDHRQFAMTYQHQVGRAVIHLGTRRHGADDIESGTRASLVVWNYNSKWWGSRVHAINYWSEAGPPDSLCLSYTHDLDYSVYKELPERIKNLKSHRPWCPPVGKEYDGFDLVFDRALGAPTKVDKSEL